MVCEGMEATPPPTMFSEQLLELACRRMRVLACPLRMRLLLGLQDREACVQDLADEVGVIRQKVSVDVNALYREGLLARRKVGTRQLYTLADYTAPRIIEQLAAGVSAHIEEIAGIIEEQ
jgi:DNA-binding transcriptional ArsR family regulator